MHSFRRKDVCRPTPHVDGTENFLFSSDREFGNQAPVQAPSSRRDRSGSNLSNADSSTAAAVAAQLAVDGSGASSANSQVGSRATGAAGATIPLGERS